MATIQMGARLAPMLALLFLPSPASAAPSTVDAARLVEAYYTFQGSEATAQRLVSALPAAQELLADGFSKEELEAALIWLFRDSDRARWAPFEDVLPDWAEKYDAQIRGQIPWDAGSAVEPEPEIVQEPDPVVEVADPPAPQPVEANEPPDDIVDDDEPVGAPPPVVAEIDDPPTPRQPRRNRGLAKGQKKGLIGLGTGLLLGGMVGGMLTGVAQGYGCDYWPGGAPLIGLIPLIGPGASHAYWSRTDCAGAINNYYAPFAVLMTVLEAAGVTLIIIGAAAPARRPRAGVIIEPLRLRLTLFPALSMDSAGFAFHGRF